MTCANWASEVAADTANFSDGQMKAALESDPTLMTEVVAHLNSYIAHLFNQHADLTKYLSYINQLYKLEAYLTNKLDADFRQTVSGNSSMNVVIHKVRQRFMDKAALVYYRSWVSHILRHTLLCILIAGALMALLTSQAIGPVLYYIALTVLGIYYVVWMYIQLDRHYRRDRTDPATYYWNKSGNKDQCN